MRIISLEDGHRPHGMEIRAAVSNIEFRQLDGNLDNLCVFATRTISEPSSAIKTGARHNYAKYLLLPVRLRRQFRTDSYDFDELRCGAMTYKDKLFVIFAIPRKGFVLAEKSDDLETYRREERPDGERRPNAKD